MYISVRKTERRELSNVTVDEAKEVGLSGCQLISQS